MKQVRMKLCWNCCKHYGLEPRTGFKKYPTTRCETCGGVPGRLGIVRVNYGPSPVETLIKIQGADK